MPAGERRSWSRGLIPAVLIGLVLPLGLTGCDGDRDLRRELADHCGAVVDAQFTQGGLTADQATNMKDECERVIEAELDRDKDRFASCARQAETHEALMACGTVTGS